jgi:RNA polymerase sigma-B factor
VAALFSGQSPDTRQLGIRSREQTWDVTSDETLFHELRSRGSVAARDQLVERYLPLARRLAGRYERSSEPLDDLVQVASLGLLKAIDRYDPALGQSFMSFAVPTIIGELRRYFRDFTWRVHVTRTLQERVLSVSSAIESQTETLGRSPRPAEVAQELGMTVEAVLGAMEAAHAHHPRSLDAPIRVANEELSTLADSIGTADERFEGVEYRAAAVQAVRALPPRERTIVYLRFAEGLTQQQIGGRMGLSQMHVSRLLRRALERMQTVAAAAA